MHFEGLLFKNFRLWWYYEAEEAANWNKSARAHIALISRINALLMHSKCAPERVMSVI